MKKILILYTSIGQGHSSFGKNIGWYLDHAGYEVKMLDFLKTEDRFIDKVATSIYKWMIEKFPFIWQWLYVSPWVHRIAKPLRVPLAGGSAKKILDVMKDFQPDMVITTQITASSAMSGIVRKKLYEGLYVIGFSEFHYHHMWVFENANGFIVNTDDQKSALVKEGFSPDTIFVCGSVLLPKKQYEKAEIMKRLDLDEEKKVIVIAAGSQGIGLPKELIQELSGDKNKQLLIVCGINSKIQSYLENRYRDNSRVKVFGFYQPMAELYTIGDLYFTKPGAMSTSEALQYGIPIFFTHSLLGQEKKDLEYLVSQNLAKNIQTWPVSRQVDFINDFLVGGKNNLSNRERSVQDLEKGNELTRIVEAVNDLFHRV